MSILSAHAQSIGWEVNLYNFVWDDFACFFYFLRFIANMVVSVHSLWLLETDNPGNMRVYSMTFV